MTRRLDRRIVVACVLMVVCFAPTADAKPVFASDLFRPNMVRRVAINPEGNVLAAVVASKSNNGVLVQQRGEAKVLVALHTRGSVRSVRWLDSSRFYVSIYEARKWRAEVVRVSIRGGELRTSTNDVDKAGWLVHAIAESPHKVLWATYDGRRTSLYRAPTASLHGAVERDEEGKAISGTRLARVSGRIFNWTIDARGEVRAGLRITAGDPSEYELIHKSGPLGGWRTIHTSDHADDAVYPQLVTPDGENLIVLSRAGRDKTGVFEFDVEAGSLGKEVFTHPEVDIDGVITNSRRNEIIGVTYEEAGLSTYRYFNSFSDRYQRSLEVALPHDVVHLQSVSSDQRFLIVVAENSRNPGVYYLLDTETNEATEVGRRKPWIDSDALVEVTALRVPTRDGFELDAFFTPPKNELGGRPALVVRPHGGPIGVRERRAFDPFVQYLAANGLAVLQVNYRGSGGYGKRFESAGNQEWSGAIEDDIDAAVDRVIAEGWVDPGRICIEGGSYGGYSALMSVVRRPDRYRCGASLNGVTDIPLIFNSSDFMAYAGAHERYAKIAGDPRTEYEAMIQRSPVYRAAEIKAPILLAHGTEDRRVDVEHYHRMRRMLDVHGNPAELLLLKGAKHSPNSKDLITYAVKLLGFLEKHLDLYGAAN